MLDIIADQFQKYMTTLPAGIPEAVGKSALVSFAAASLISSDLNRGRIIGLIAVVSALVDAFTLPIFRQLLGNQAGNVAWYHHAVAIVVNLAVTQGIINTLTSYRVDLVASSVLMIAMSLYFHGMNDHSTRYARYYVLF